MKLFQSDFYKLQVRDHSSVKEVCQHKTTPSLEQGSTAGTRMPFQMQTAGLSRENPSWSVSYKEESCNFQADGTPHTPRQSVPLYSPSGLELHVSHRC